MSISLSMSSLSRSCLRSSIPSLRSYSTPSGPSSTIKLVAELRKLTQVSITKAKEALVASQNDIDGALQWLEKDLAESGAKKAVKLAGRSTSQGLISVAVLANGSGGSSSGAPSNGNGKRHGIRSAMVELNCETDFVARSELFGKLAADIANTAAFLGENATRSSSSSSSANSFPSWDIDQLNDSPLVPVDSINVSPHTTVRSSIQDALVKLGEQIQLRRATALIEPTSSLPSQNLNLRVASYLHGGTSNAFQGQIGALALLALKSHRLNHMMPLEAFQKDLGKLERSLARQIVGFDTTSVDGPEGEGALYKQPFIMYPGDLSGYTVGEALEKWAEKNGLVSEDTDVGAEEGSGLRVLQFAKWSVGGPLA